jgi:hypothetical protein
VPEWVQQLRIHSCQASEVLGVNLIRFAFVGVDESQFAGIGHKDLVGAPFEQTAYPGRVGSCLYGYAQWLLLGGEASPEGLWGRTQPTLLDHLAALSVSMRQR